LTPDQRRELIKANIAKQLAAAKKAAATGAKRPMKRETIHPHPNIGKP